MIVSPDDLAHQASRYEGKRIIVHACLTITPHGDFISRCGAEDRRDITLVIPAKERSDLLYKPFRAPGVNYSYRVEADFEGTVVQQRVQWPDDHLQWFLSVAKLENARARKP